MFENYLQSISDLKADHQQFVIDLTSYITKHVEDESPMYAVHGFCTDGGVSGSMIRYAEGGKAAIIPIDYWILNNKSANEVLSNINWKGIVDLKPFNINPLDFWVDHHISAMNTMVNAKRIRFDQNGDSGAYQLLLSHFLGPLPEHLVELAVMTRTTDTAGYTTEPPAEIISSIEELGEDIRRGESSRLDEERRIWLLDDAWGSVRSLKDHLDLYNYLAKDGFFGLRHVLPRVNQLREGRQQARDIADQINLDTDIIIFAFDEDTQDKFTILRRLQSNGAKVAVSFSKAPSGVKISLRRNRHLTQSDNERIQLQKIAEQLGGGGHPGASGAFAQDVETGFQAIKQWGQTIGLSTKLIEL